MNDFRPLLEIVAYTTLIVVPTLIVVRFLAGGDGVALADLFAASRELPWPRGVQEEEPVSWRVEHLSPGKRVVASATEPSRQRPAGRSTAGVGIERRCA